MNYDFTFFLVADVCLVCMLAGKNKHFNDESCLALNKFRMEEAVMSVKMQNKTTWARISAGYCVHLHSFRVRLSHLIGCYRPPIHGTIYTTGVKGILIGGLHSQKKEFACKKRIIVASSFFYNHWSIPPPKKVVCGQLTRREKQGNIYAETFTRWKQHPLGMCWYLWWQSGDLSSSTIAVH